MKKNWLPRPGSIAETAYNLIKKGATAKDVKAATGSSFIYGYVMKRMAKVAKKTKTAKLKTNVALVEQSPLVEIIVHRAEPYRIITTFDSLVEVVARVVATIGGV